MIALPGLSLPCTGERRTIAESRTLEGIGLHHGKLCRLTFKPGATGSGILFQRTDIANARPVAALAKVAADAERRTQLGTGDDALHTVEHVLAAVGALSIDDLLIEMDAAEPPIMDGSAQAFLDALLEARVVSNGGCPQWLVVRKPFRFVDGESEYEAVPSDRLELDVRIDFPHPLIGTQQSRYVLSGETFARELAAARTFGFVRDVEEGKRIVGIKNVTINEPFFQGHFPGHPIMPGVLIIESMAQVGGMLLMRTIADPKSKVVYFMSLDNIKFRRPVKPGDQLRIELDVVHMRGSTCRMRGVAKVDGEIATEAEFAAMIRDR